VSLAAALERGLALKAADRVASDRVLPSELSKDPSTRHSPLCFGRSMHWRGTICEYIRNNAAGAESLQLMCRIFHFSIVQAVSVRRYECVWLRSPLGAAGRVEGSVVTPRGAGGAGYTSEMRFVRGFLGCSVVIAGLAMAAAQPAWAWGHDGHMMVNLLAQQNLPADVPAFLRNGHARDVIEWMGPEPDRWKQRDAEPEL